MNHDIAQFQLTQAQRFLLISAKPAPNGGLHLGHIAGPYLRQDMLRRHYQLRGASVTVVGGTDPVDSFISLRAAQDDSQPTGVAQRYYQQIVQDFASYDIHLDAFIDPLSAPWRERYVASFAEVVARAQANGRAVERTRAFPFFAGQGERGASGAWSCGQCPDCGVGVSGYFCENCGAHFDPHEIVAPQARSGSGQLHFRPVDDLFFEVRNPEALLASLATMEVAPPLRAIVARQFARGRNLVRLSERSDWGIPIGSDVGRRYFGHGLLYGYCRLLGELYMEHSGDPVHPFDAASEVTSVNLFGIDNTVSHMVNIQAIGAEVDGWKGFDAFVVNRFYLLEGKKFSTSARHLIWAHELIHATGADSDAVRFVISASSPSTEERDLRVDEFLRCYNDVYVGTLQRRIVEDLAALDGTTCAGLDPTVQQHFAPLWHAACEGHRFAAYAPEEQVALILNWLRLRAELDADGPDALASWLRCMVLLLYPVAPRLAGWAWTALGFEGLPQLALAGQAARCHIADAVVLAKPLSHEALFRAMPDGAIAHARAHAGA